MAAPICDNEDYFSRPNKHQYNDIIGIIGANKGIAIKTFQKQKLRPGYWVDTRRFISKTKRELANGMFEIFGDFTNESASSVRDNLVGWIYDNYRSVERWTHVILQHKDMTLSGWIESIRKDSTPGDDMCLYLLARMYNKHVYVHNKMFYWCTAVHVIKREMDLDLINDCDVELVFVHPWVFGEVKRVRVPKGIIPVPGIPITKTKEQSAGITENTSDDARLNITEKTTAKKAQTAKACSVTLTRIDVSKTSTGSNPDVQVSPPTGRACRKRTVTDYKKLINYGEEEELDNIVLKRKRSTNLLRKPSRNRQRIERNRRRNKTKKTLTISTANKSRPSSVAGTSTSSAPSDSLSPKAQITNLTTATTIMNPSTETPEVASTSTAELTQPTQDTTILVAATKEETKIAIDALLSLGNDLQYETDTTPTDNDLLQPIDPGKTLPDPTIMVSELNADDTEILETHVTTDAESEQTKSNGKKGKNKGQLVVQNFRLARNRKPKRRFSCVGCSQKFDNNRELNDHFKTAHPPLTCSDCKKLFNTPSAFEKHKYTHYEFMVECDKCGKGFHFESELSAHRRKHIADQGLVCFHANCGKRFKRSSELNAHLKNHTGKPIKCDYCEYLNKDIRNVKAHSRVHFDIEKFVCGKCGKKFKWGSQKKRHVDSGKCPG